MAFSSSIMLADLDYIAPSNACIKPMMVKQPQPASPNGNGGAPNRMTIGEPMSAAEIVKISLQDCLACSGCVTSAETMLVEKQSKDEILNELGENLHKPVAVSISDQSAASIAVQLGVGIPAAMEVISGFAREVLRAQTVVDIRWADRVSVFETAVEFVDRVQNRPEALPMIVSSCPGWVCYCEKSHPGIIPNLCPVKSGQAIAAEFLKNHLKEQFGAGKDTPDAHVASTSFHISIQPCFDKKLEAVREDFGDMESGDRFTDFVISSAELLEWMREVDPTPEKRWTAPLDSTPDPGRPPCNLECEAVHMEGSGGYHQFALQYALQQLHETNTTMEQIQYTTKRNANHKIIPFTMPGDHGAQKEFCVAYGFQHIQNIVRGINRKMASAAKYVFIELMACPDGCLNGGGQIRTKKHDETMAAVNSVFESYTADLAARGNSPDTPLGGDAPLKAKRQEDVSTSREENSKMKAQARDVKGWVSFNSVYDTWLKAPAGSQESHQQLCTQFHDRKAQMEEMLKEAPIAQSLKW